MSCQRIMVHELGRLEFRGQPERATLAALNQSAPPGWEEYLSDGVHSPRRAGSEPPTRVRATTRLPVDNGLFAHARFTNMECRTFVSRRFEKTMTGEACSRSVAGRRQRQTQSGNDNGSGRRNTTESAGDERKRPLQLASSRSRRQPQTFLTWMYALPSLLGVGTIIDAF